MKNLPLKLRIVIKIFSKKKIEQISANISQCDRVYYSSISKAFFRSPLYNSWEILGHFRKRFTLDISLSTREVKCRASESKKSDFLTVSLRKCVSHLGSRGLRNRTRDVSRKKQGENGLEDKGRRRSASSSQRVVVFLSSC